MSRTSVKDCRWHLCDDAGALAARAARIVLRVAAEAVRERGHFKIALAGGNTPRGIYAQLASAEADWKAWEIYFGDERCLPPDDPQRNSRMAGETWLDRVAIPRERIHPIPAEQGPEAGAQAYTGIVARALPFDIVLLGLGEDGHTAALFPDQQHPSDPAVPVRNAPKPPAERVSLSAKTLSNARHVFFLVSGAAKRAAVSAWLHSEAIPAARITPTDGVDVLLDLAAWPHDPGGGQ